MRAVLSEARAKRQSRTITPDIFFFSRPAPTFYALHQARSLNPPRVVRGGAVRGKARGARGARQLANDVFFKKSRGRRRNAAFQARQGPWRRRWQSMVWVAGGEETLVRTLLPGPFIHFPAA